LVVDRILVAHLVSSVVHTENVGAFGFETVDQEGLDQKTLDQKALDQKALDQRIYVQEHGPAVVGTMDVAVEVSLV
jgi:hypothetical protein